VPRQGLGVRDNCSYYSLERGCNITPPSGKLALKLSERSYPSVVLVACRRCASSRSIHLSISVVLSVLSIFRGIP
jgi:hypothetical protein